MPKVLVTESYLEDIADAIREKTGSNNTYTPGQMAAAISSISGGEVPLNDVNFIDYDGTILYSYTASEFAQLSAFPPNPSHTGLTAQGWNWDLQDAKTYVAGYTYLNIGQMYITDDGKTRLYISLDQYHLESSVRFACTKVGGIVINWGDGTSEASIKTGTNTYTHTYAEPGEYIITLDPVNGAFTVAGGTTVNIMGATAGNVSDTLVRAEIGASITMNSYWFQYCSRLEYVTLPSHITTMGAYCFRTCRSLKAIVIPKQITSCGTYSFAYDHAIKIMALPKLDSINSYFLRECLGLISATPQVIAASTFASCASLQQISFKSPSDYIIKTNTFSGCRSIKKLIIPSSITEIQSGAFNACYSMREYHFLSTTPPTLADVDAFESIPKLCIIYVPASSVDTYRTATNWSTYADYIQPEPT